MPPLCRGLTAHPVNQPVLAQLAPVGLLLPPAEHFTVTLATVAAKAGRHQVAGHGQSAAGLGQYVVEALSWVTAIGAAVRPGLKDCLSESVACGAGRDELCSIDACLHEQPVAGPMLEEPGNVKACNKPNALRRL